MTAIAHLRPLRDSFLWLAAAQLPPGPTLDFFFFFLLNLQTGNRLSHNNTQERSQRPLAPAHSRGSLPHSGSREAPPETRTGSAGDSGPAAGAAAERAQAPPRANLTLSPTRQIAAATRLQASTAPSSLSLPSRERPPGVLALPAARSDESRPRCSSPGSGVARRPPSCPEFGKGVICGVCRDACTLDLSC